MSRWDLHPERVDRAVVVAAYHPDYRDERDVLAVLREDHEARWRC